MMNMALSASTVLKRGLLKRCAVCGEGNQFRAWLRMRPSCRRCGYRFHRAPGQWLGSWFLNVIVAQTVVVLVLVTVAALSWPHTSASVLISATLLSAIVTPVLFFPFSRTIWIAIDLVMKPLDFDDDVAPGFELERDVAVLAAEQGSAPRERDEP